MLVKLLVCDLDGDTEGSTSRLLMTQNWEEQLIHHMGMLPFTETSTGTRNSLTRTLWISTKANTKSWTSAGNNPMHQYRLDAIWLENSFADKDLGVILTHFTVLATKHWTRLPSEAVECPSLEILKTQQHSWEISAGVDPCFEQGLCSRWSPEVYSNLNHSLFLCCKKYWLALSWIQPNLSWLHPNKCGHQGEGEVLPL